MITRRVTASKHTSQSSTGVQGYAADRPIRDGARLPVTCVEQGVDLETVQQLLGHANLDHVLPNLAVSDRKLRQMFCEVL
ncbi:hypothetical protein BDI4_1240016 [Burkholderia diffusa]|nr:hypothetical protein BDI4_1240016 [Burkholderia diffusa]